MRTWAIGLTSWTSTILSNGFDLFLEICFEGISANVDRIIFWIFACFPFLWDVLTQGKVENFLLVPLINSEIIVYVYTNMCMELVLWCRPGPKVEGQNSRLLKFMSRDYRPSWFDYLQPDLLVQLHECSSVLIAGQNDEMSSGTVEIEHYLERIAYFFWRNQIKLLCHLQSVELIFSVASNCVREIWKTT